MGDYAILLKQTKTGSYYKQVLIMNQLSNCVYCGKLILVEKLKCCSSCLIQTEEVFNKCVRFLETAPSQNQNISQLSHEVGISVSEIYNFVLDGRLYFLFDQIAIQDAEKSHQK
jgi:predicted amidophosphoribosyltransferase